jgi:hypothetical protein
MLQINTHALVYWLLTILISWPIINLHGLDFQNEWFISSVAYVVGPSVNTFFVFHIFGIEIFEIRHCEHIDWKLDWCFLLNPFKNQYLPHLNSENWEINFIKFDLLRAFQ